MSKIPLKLRKQKGLPPTLIAKNYINGEWRKSHSKKRNEARNPNNKNDITAIYPESNRLDVQEALEAAHLAFPEWRDTPAPMRASAISNWHRLLKEKFEQGACILSRVTGKHRTAARGEHQESIDTLMFMAAQGRQMYGKTLHSELPGRASYTIRTPKGVAGLIAAGNFPSAVPIWKMAPALVAGNTVVYRPASNVALITYHLIQTAIDAGIPPGVINVVHGSGKNGAGQYLIEEGVKDVPFDSSIRFDHYLQHISFTGSNQVGRWIANTASNKVTQSLELGGNNPMYVHKDANLELAVEIAIASGFEDAGQRCTSLHNLILHQDIQYTFRHLFLKAVDQIIVGDTYNNDRPKVTYGPMMTEKWARSFMDHYKQFLPNKEHGDRLLRGDPCTDGMITEKNKKNFVGDPDLGLYAMPTVWDFGENHDADLIRTEVFGPTVNLLTVKNEDEAIKIATKTAYGLSSSVITNNMALAQRWEREVETGIKYINGRTIGAESHLPFGALKDGRGKESGVWVFNDYTNLVAVTADYTGKLQEAQVGVKPLEMSEDPVDYSKL